MFGKKKKDKKSKKVEKIFADSSAENQEGIEAQGENQAQESELSDEELFMGVQESEEEDSGYSEQQKNKIDKLTSVRDKISKILKSSNIEIVDENFGDEYESGDGAVDAVQQQQDYDSLKNLFGDRGKGKGKELTLTIDEFDYTHVGQYIEEFDLMHLKGIKKVKITKKHSKWVKRLAIIGSVVVVLAVGIVVALQLTREKPVVLSSISLNQSAGTYYINEKFDYSGLYIYANYSDGSVQRVKLSHSNFSGTVGGNNNTENGNITFLGGSPVTITFNYQGFTVNYVAEVKTKVVNGVQVLYDDSLFLLKKDDVITQDTIKLFVLHKDGCPPEIAEISSRVSLVVNGVTYNYDVAKKGFFLNNLIGDITSVSLTYETYTVDLDPLTNSVKIQK